MTQVECATPVQWMDLPAMHAPMMEEIRAALDQVLDEHTFILGPAVESFEQAFAEYCGVQHCVAVNSGTSALHLALICAGVQPGDEVITTPLSWVSTSWAISYIGARPIFVDVDPHTFCLDPALIEAAITPRTRVVLPVHLYGHPADMDAITATARRHGLVVVEDAAQAHGARYRGRHCGSLADIAAFSFYPGKNLGAFGEGGAITTSNPDWARRARELRDHAQAGRHHHVEIGFNYRMDGLQGAVLQVKLAHLETWNAARRQIAEWYRVGLAGLAGAVIPEPAGDVLHAWHIYALQHERRDALRGHLAGHGIQTAVHYPRPIHLQPAYADLGLGPGALPVAESIARRQISLPMHPGLSAEIIDRISQALHAFA